MLPSRYMLDWLLLFVRSYLSACLFSLAGYSLLFLSFFASSFCLVSIYCLENFSTSLACFYSGPIPASFPALTQLEIIDLTFNAMSGKTFSSCTASRLYAFIGHFSPCHLFFRLSKYDFKFIFQGSCPLNSLSTWLNWKLKGAEM